MYIYFSWLIETMWKIPHKCVQFVSKIHAVILCILTFPFKCSTIVHVQNCVCACVCGHGCACSCVSVCVWWHILSSYLFTSCVHAITFFLFDFTQYNVSCSRSVYPTLHSNLANMFVPCSSTSMFKYKLKPNSKINLYSFQRLSVEYLSY